MPGKEDILAAKQLLSARLLSVGLRNRVMAKRYTTRMREAVVSVGANVHAVGIGRKVVHGKSTQVLGVRIYVVQKFAESAIPPRDLLPKELEGIPCDVIESPPAFITQPGKKSMTATASPHKSKGKSSLKAAVANCSDDRQSRQRPFSAGISVAHRDVTAGTIGYFCRSTQQGDDPGDICILSNNHVLANVNEGADGDEVLQPGPADGGASLDRIANLHRFVRIRLGGDVPNRVDAAIARLVPDIGHNVSVCRIGAITGTDRGVEEMRVRKHGRTSGLTDGVITDESVDSLVGMDHSNPDIVALFQGQLRIERTSSSSVFGLGGDSGSLVVNADNRAVGLYFAGPDNGLYGLANHIRDVLDELHIELIV